MGTQVTFYTHSSSSPGHYEPRGTGYFGQKDYGRQYEGYEVWRAGHYGSDSWDDLPLALQQVDGYIYGQSNYTYFVVGYPWGDLAIVLMIGCSRPIKWLDKKCQKANNE